MPSVLTLLSTMALLSGAVLGSTALAWYIASHDEVAFYVVSAIVLALLARDLFE